jgi:calmodulin
MVDKLTEQQRAQYFELFSKFDVDNTGTINAQELNLALTHAGFTLSESEVNDLLKEFDTDGNGVIDFAEFISMICKKSSDVDAEEELRELFMIFDSNGSGGISSAEIRYVLKALGESFTEEEIDELMAEGDKDGDGFLNYEEFMNLMLAK